MLDLRRMRYLHQFCTTLEWKDLLPFPTNTVVICHNKILSSRLGGWNNRNLFSCSSGNWKSMIKVLAGLSSESSFLGLQMSAFLLCSHMSEREFRYLFLFRKGSSHIQLGVTSLNFSYLFKVLSPSTATLRVCDLGLGF